MDARVTHLLRIKQCSDPLMWYADKVGQSFPYLGTYPEGDHKTREPAGYVNIVRPEDADIIPVGENHGLDT